MEQSLNRVTSTRIGKKAFVGGLFWQSLTRPRELKKEASELAKKNNFDLYLIRQGDGVAQTGLASTKDGYTPGMISLAGAIAKKVSDEGVVIDGQTTRAHNWIGALALPDGRWIYLAVRDDAIMPTGDFVGSKDEAISQLEQNYGLGGWAAVIGTDEIESYGYHNFVNKSLEEFVGADGKGISKHASEATLKGFKFSVSPKVVVIGAMISLATFGAAYGMKSWKQEQERIALEAVMEQARIEENAKKALAAANAVAPHPWATAPIAQDLAAACESGFGNLAPGGWAIESLSCSSTGITYSLIRGNSTLGQLRTAEPSVVIGSEGDKATLIRPVRFHVMQDEPLGRSTEIRERLQDLMQRMSIKLVISLIEPPKPVAKLPGEVNTMTPEPAVPDWNTHAFALGPTNYSPSVLASLFEEPGVRWDTILYRKGEWIYEGHIYAR